jgi:hypothetical protein
MGWQAWALARRCHCSAYVLPTPDHAPGVAVRTLARCAVPLSAGAVVLTGGPAAMTAVCDSRLAAAKLRQELREQLVARVSVA